MQGIRLSPQTLIEKIDEIRLKTDCLHFLVVLLMQIKTRIELGKFLPA